MPSTARHGYTHSIIDFADNLIDVVVADSLAAEEQRRCLVYLLTGAAALQEVDPVATTVTILTAA